MKNYVRVLKLALRFRFTLAGLFFSSLLVALFWGGNIGACIRSSRSRSGASRCRLGWPTKSPGARPSRPSCGPKSSVSKSRSARGRRGDRRDAREIELLRKRLQAEQAALATAGWLKPYIHGYLPADPFQTIVWIVVALMVATVVKDFFIFANSMLVERLVQMVAFDLRKQLYHHTLRMDLSEFGEQRTGTMMSRFNVDMGYLSQRLELPVRPGRSGAAEGSGLPGRRGLYLLAAAGVFLAVRPRGRAF